MLLLSLGYGMVDSRWLMVIAASVLMLCGLYVGLDVGDVWRIHFSGFFV